jgi:hypothetical protein
MGDISKGVANTLAKKYTKKVSGVRDARQEFITDD